MSTRAEIGRSPTAASRSCSQGGLGRLVTPRKARPTNSGHAASSPAGNASVICSGEANIPGTGLKSLDFSSPRPAAASSRAMPRTPKQSLRFGVTATSITGPSTLIASLAGRPTGASAGSSMIPAWSSPSSSSRAEHSMPLLSTPRIVTRFRTSPVPGMVVPTGANTAFMPARTLGAPHTTSTIGRRRRPGTR